MVVELLWKTKKITPEIARKIIHIVAGSFIAFWPFFMSWQTIQLLSLAMFIVVYLSHHFGIFKAIHGVKRSTNGELLYPVGIGIIALLQPPEWVFAAALLHLAIGDGLAAIIGVRYGQNNQYKIGDHIKSLAGSLAFFVVSALIIVTVYAINLETVSASGIAILFCLPVLVTLIENFFVGGLDNVLVPLAVTLVLSLTQQS
jgi:dolichol kinase